MIAAKLFVTSAAEPPRHMQSRRKLWRPNAHDPSARALRLDPRRANYARPNEKWKARSWVRPRRSAQAIYIAAWRTTLKLTRPVHPMQVHRRRLARAVGENRGASRDLLRDRVITYTELDSGTNRYARWAAASVKSTAVTLLMENCPEYLMAWLGLVKNGCIAALVARTSRSAQRSINVITQASHSGAGLAGSATAVPGLDGVPRFGRLVDLSPAARIWMPPLLCNRAPGSAMSRARTSIAATRRFTSIRLAPRGCPRPRTSAICGCSIS